jgi:hypothetical protein
MDRWKFYDITHRDGVRRSDSQTRTPMMPT